MFRVLVHQTMIKVIQTIETFELSIFGLVWTNYMHFVSCKRNYLYIYYASRKRRWLTSVLSFHCCVGLPLWWKAFFENTTPHQQHWANSIQKSPSNHLYVVGCTSDQHFRGWQPITYKLLLGGFWTCSCCWWGVVFSKKATPAQWQANTAVEIRSVQRWVAFFYCI